MTKHSTPVQLSNAQYYAFVENRLKLPKGKRSEYIAQVDTLIERFTKAAAEAPDIEVKQFRKCGSLWKGTVLRPRGDNGVDADIAVYINVPQTSNIDDLHARIKRLLVKVYPTKSSNDFQVQPRTLGIHFVASDLDVDLVPVIPIDAANDYGYQPSSKGAPLLLTSIPRQLTFIAKHKDAYSSWTTLVRILKRWRNENDVPLKSFAIELLVSYLQDARGIPSTIEEGLSRFWLFLAQELPGKVISFDPVYGGQGVGSYIKSPIIVIDPVNKDNNITQRITIEECNMITSDATNAWELLHNAMACGGKGDTLSHLRAIFGNDFDFE